MINKLVISSLLVLFSSALNLPPVKAQVEEPYDTRIEKYEDLTQVELDDETTDIEMSEMESEDGAVEPTTRTEETLEEVRSLDDTNYDIRRTEAFNLVSSAYRGDFEEQGINSYAILVSNYQSGELTAEDLIQAAIESGELSNSAMEDNSYVEAVESQLDALVKR